jgi:hypothetical protein
VQSGEHCRPFSIYAVTQVVNTSAQNADVHQLAAVSVVSLNWLPAISATAPHPTELNTGPPPDNLVVSLHRFLI